MPVPTPQEADPGSLITQGDGHAVEAPSTERWQSFSDRLRRYVELVLIPLLALGLSEVVFSAILLSIGKSPLAFFELLWLGAFGTAFSWQNTLQRAAPLILTALCVALPAQAGLVVIGGEGALVIGGLAAATVALVLIDWAPAALALAVMAIAGGAAGALWIGFVGLLRHRRGVNETIASLLLFYIAVAILSFLVEGPLRDAAASNKPSTRPIGHDFMIGTVPGTDLHWGLPVGVVLCVLAYVVMNHTTFGFAVKIAGGNARAALGQGLPVGRLIISCCLLGGMAAGLAGFFEIVAVHGSANASLVAGYGFTGILVSFLARHSPLAIPPVAILFGGLAAAGGLIQRRLGLPDATVALFQGIIFVALLASETLYGRLRLLRLPGKRSPP